MILGVYSNGLGTVNVDGGSVTLLTKLVLGNCPTGGMGVVNVAGAPSTGAEFVLRLWWIQSPDWSQLSLMGMRVVAFSAA